MLPWVLSSMHMQREKPWEGDFFTTKLYIKNQLHIKENVFSKIALDIFTQSKMQDTSPLFKITVDFCVHAVYGLYVLYNVQVLGKSL
jgi:hypothetical protein